VASRREQKEALRREREERQRKASEAKARKRLVGYGAAAVLALAATAALVVLVAGGGEDSGASTDVLPDGGSVPEQQEFELAAAAEAAGCELRSVKATGTAEHTQDPNERIEYKSNPPTSGRHFVVPAEDGAYSEAPADEELVHTLEHGRVVVWFKRSLPRSTRADLKAFFDEDSYQMVLAPRTDMPQQVTASAWNGDPAPGGTGRLLLCARVDEETWDALRAFRDEHRSRGPEAVP
jgi:hypothetical protein